MYVSNVIVKIQSVIIDVINLFYIIMNNKYRSLIFRNSNILRLNKISLKHIFPIIPFKGGTINGKTKLTILYDSIKYAFYESEINKNNYILYSDHNIE